MHTLQFNRIRDEAIEILRLGGPLIAAQLAQIAITFVDTVMAGRLSAKDLASVAVGANLWGAAWIFNTGVLVAITPSVAQLFGAGKTREAAHCAREGLWLSQIVAVVSFFAIRSVAPHLIQWMRIDPEIVPSTLGYIDAITWGLPAICGFQALRGFSEGVSRTKPVMFISVFALGLNILGNWVFMYGRFGMPALGAVGCGVASAIVMWFMFAAMCGVVAFQRPYQPFQLFRRLDWPDRGEILALARLGLPIGVSLFMEASMFTVVALWTGAMGKFTTAAHQIALNVASVTFMVPLGLAMAITVRVGQAIGAGRPDRARFSGFVGIALAALFMAGAALTLFVFPNQIIGIYTRDPMVHSIALTLLSVAAIFQVSDGLQVSGNGALRGLKDTRVPMLITVLAYWAIGIPLGYTLGILQGGGVRGVWIGIVAGLSVAAVLLNSRFYFETNRMVRGLPK